MQLGENCLHWFGVSVTSAHTCLVVRSLPQFPEMAPQLSGP